MNWQHHIQTLKNHAESLGVTQAQIAAKTGIKQPHIARFFAAKHCPRLDTFLSIAEALGVKFETVSNLVTTKKYSAYIRFGSERHDEIENWCHSNNTIMDYENGILQCHFPSQELADAFSKQFPTFVEKK